jgi:quercetin dioxygenase-like cupin family protein
MHQLMSLSTEAVPVTSADGAPTTGAFMVNPMLVGEHVALLEVHMEKGVCSQRHAHEHECLLYVVCGMLKTIVADEVLIVRAGHACRHPEGITHSVEALEDTLFLEIKSPVPALDSIFGDLG